MAQRVGSGLRSSLLGLGFVSVPKKMRQVRIKTFQIAGGRAARCSRERMPSISGWPKVEALLGGATPAG
jgi:hypothetical protein